MFNPDIDVPYQVDNPSDDERHMYLKFLLTIDEREADYENILELLSPPPDILTITSKLSGRGVNVAVIGAGEAGLSAAFELRKTGCSITVFEATDRIGGRVFTHYFDKSRKYFADLGAMRIPSSHETTWHYIKLFSLNTKPFVTRNTKALFYLRGARALNDPSGLSVRRNIYERYNLTKEEINTPWFKLSERIKKNYLIPLSPAIRRELIQPLKKYSNEIEIIDDKNLRQAYESAGLSQDAISMIGFLSTFDQSFFRLSLTEVLQEAYTVDMSYTYYIEGGMQNLPLSLYSALKNERTDVYKNIALNELGTVSFRMKCPVNGIYKSDGGLKIVLEYKDDSSYTHYEKFDYVICTIPFSSLRRVNIDPEFNTQKMQAINEMNYETAHKTFFFLKDRFWEIYPFCIAGGSTSTDLPLISLFYPSDHAMPVPFVLNGWVLNPKACPLEPGVLLASYNWPMDSIRLGNEFDSLRISDIKKYVEAIHGLPFGFLDDRLIDYKSIIWSNVQYEWSAACLTKPKDKVNFSYIVTQPEMDGRVFFAGEHISQEHAWQQGALNTGMIAANEIAKKIKERSA